MITTAHLYTPQHRQLYVLLVCYLMLCGCANVSKMGKNFTPTERINLAPFAEQTLAMINDVDYAYKDSRVIFTQDFIQRNDSAITRYQQNRANAEYFLRSIVAYSLEIVALSEDKTSQSTKCKNLASFLEKLGQPVYDTASKQDNFNPKFARSQLDRIARQTVFLNAIQAAHPLVERVANIGHKTFRNMQSQLQTLEPHLAGQLKSQYGQMLALSNELTAQQNDIAGALRYVQQIRTGDTNQWAELLNHRQITHLNLGKVNRTRTDLLSIQRNLTKELQNFETIKSQLTSAKNDYFQDQALIEKAIERERRFLKQARITMIFWSKAHQKMASGLVEPAKWFDISNPENVIEGIMKVI